MSQENTSITGSLTVGKSATVGGELRVRGDSVFDHDLTIKGWLEAPNIKHVNKGMFATEERLKEVYPEPRNGWWAIVDDELPGDLYVAWNGQWVKTGKQGGNPTIDSENFERLVTISIPEINEITGYENVGVRF